MAVDTKRITEFLAASPVREQVARVVVGSGFAVTAVSGTDHDPKSWFVHLRPSRDAATMFGGRQEVLLWVAEHKELQARTFQAITACLERSRPRLNEEFVILCSGDINARDVIAHQAHSLDTTFVPLLLSELGALAGQPSSLLALLRERLYSRDLYAFSGPALDEVQFYGRRSLIDHVVAQLRTGGQHVGMLGLRKMGKTSLLAQVQRKLRERKGLYVARVDLQRICAINPSTEYFLWSLGTALVDQNPAVRARSGRLLNAASFSDIAESDRPHVRVRFYEEMVRLLQEENRRIVFLVDEIERMWPLQAAQDDSVARSYLDSWRLLRGLEQEASGKISYFVTGTTARCLEAPTVAGEDNPLHRYIALNFLPHLEYDEVESLLSGLGAKMGLDWTASAARAVYRLVGGHPSLLRTVGSVVNAARGSTRAEFEVTQQVIDGLSPRIAALLSPAFDQILAALKLEYPDDYYMLELLAGGQRRQFEELASAMPDATAHLRGYALVDDQQRPQIRLAALQAWLQRQSASRSVAINGVVPLEPGQCLGPYVVREQIGGGGFGTVYKCSGAQITDGTDAPVALKVIHDGSYERLMREVEILRGIEHKNIVKIIDHGEDNGRPYLVMEWLAGEPLSSRTNAARRLRSADDASTMLGALLRALRAMHPNGDRVAELRAKSELSPVELDELLAVRHGVVHRDVKPENVILVDGRGPVLIDFGISSRVEGRVLTVSGTPGRLPPDFARARWDQDVDLYQLGLTMLEVMVGIGLTSQLGVEDLLNELDVTWADHSASRVLKVVRKLVAPSRADRYRSADAALKDLGRKSAPGSGAKGD